MRASRIAGIAISALVIGTPSAFGQTPPPTQPQQPPTKQTTSPPMKSSDTAATQTFVGCLMKETDYRRAHNLGGGAVGGVGLGDEFVLVNVKVSDVNSSGTALSSDMSAKSSSASSAKSSANAASSASKCVDQGTAYRLTGTNEEKIKGLVGKQLEIQGRFKHADDVTASTATAGEKEKLPAEVEIVSFREAPGRDAVNEQAASTAPAMSTREPAARDQTTPQPQPQTDPQQPANPNPATAKSELPRTASATPLLALIGIAALSAGFILTMMRRRTQ